MITGRRVKAPIASAQRCRDRFYVRQIPFHRFEFSAPQTPQVAARTDQGLYPVSPRHQLVHQVGSDEPGCARYKAIHILLPLSSARLLRPSQRFRFCPPAQ